MKKIITLLLLFTAIHVAAQAPANYYTNAEGKTTSELKTALHNIISSGYVTKSYDYLYTIFETSDRTASGNIWDMYSTCTWSFGVKKCGNYSNICDCYNREHTIPQSWFNKQSPMVSDAFHIYPTDGKVNGIRDNYPYGETNALPLGGKGLGKLGTSSFPGYSGTVFEPIDEYKGDLARTYFYFATRYENIMTTIGGESFNKTTYPSFPEWTINLFLKWHRQDPVSQKEIDRNNAIYVHQRNRNPFIDHPELAEHIWGDKKGVAWKVSDGTGGNEGNTPDCENLNFSAPFSSTLSPFTAYSVSGNQKWTLDTQYGAKMTGYVDGTVYANEDWLISPKINLSEYSNVTLNFDHALNFATGNINTNHTLWISKNYDSGNPSLAQWEQITISNYPVGSNWDFISSGDISIPEDYWVENFVFAFKFMCGSSASSTWEIKNLTLTGDCQASSVALEFMPKEYPISTTHSSITVYNLENEDVSLFNIYGQHISTMRRVNGNASFDVPVLGVYILKVDRQAIKVIVR